MTDRGVLAVSSLLPPPMSQRSGVALCLSGGGYRASLFHLGALRRLDEIGVLPKITTISSVSGGSIVNGFLATRFPRWPSAAADPEFDGFARDVRDLTRRNIRAIPSFLSLERAYRRRIGPQTLGELPDQGPNFVFCATDMANGVNWTFSRDLEDAIDQRRWEAGSYQAGFAPASDIPLARAIAASSAFPPVIGPVRVPIEEQKYEYRPPKHEPYKEQGITAHLRLTDGGVYDNLGLEPVWKTHQIVLVSDGGATLDPAPYSPFRPWKRLGRYMTLANSQGGSIRKRWLISSFNRDDEHGYQGAYFGIGSDARGYKQHSELAYPPQLVDELISEVRTDLDVFSDEEAAVIQNHGYLICDAAIRSWIPTLAEPEPPPRPPFPGLLDPDHAADVLIARKSGKRRIPFGRFR